MSIGRSSVSASDFRDIVVRGDAGKAERLFRAAVSAFCSLPRPSRREVAQLDDLTLPLIELVSVEARRYVAAALSECLIAPPGLLGRLADDRVDVAAPLLVRSPLLGDVDLIALIGKHGLPHARAIARRPQLNPTIAQLIRALEASAAAAAQASPEPAEAPAPEPEQRSAEETRQRLRAMMREELDARRPRADDFAPDPALFGKLRDTALTGNDLMFQTALADALGMSVEAVRAIARLPGYSSLLAALRALDLGEEQAFLITAAVSPTQFPHPETIRMFIERYRALDRAIAVERVRGWKLEMVANWIQRNGAAARASGSASGTAAAKRAGAR
jgi:uncharacterized protein (DUF2336 family)